MPTFGPAYIPFYGSLREFNEVYDEYSELNFGSVSNFNFIFCDISDKIRKLQRNNYF